MLHFVLIKGVILNLLYVYIDVMLKYPQKCAAESDCVQNMKGTGLVAQSVVDTPITFIRLAERLRAPRGTCTGTCNRTINSVGL